MTREPSVFERVDEPPALELQRVKEVSPRELGFRFAAGAITSIVAGVLTLAIGPRAGGIMLAFPAILAASLTLIEDQEDSAEAREDARGAIAGGCALGVFAAVCAVTFTRWNAALVLAAATGAWVLAALGLYGALWFRGSQLRARPHGGPEPGARRRSATGRRRDPDG